ncbi:copper resistance CopC family protein [Micromonospora sp. CPCC 205711]|uniref:copper resistance CopC family protein n=1 Tax=Micromonospora sp. CPCC 205547 TaxID=3122400 RepID=UPI002FF130CA
MALGVSLLPAAPAFAHNSLTGSNPADGARVAAAPERIELRFLARPQPETTKITVVGPDNVPAAGGAPSFSGSRVSVPFRAGKAGLYIVGYELASSDGHPVRGEVRFTLTAGTAAQPPTGTPSTPTAPSASPSAAPTTVGSTPPAQAVPAADDAAGGGGRGWLWAVGALVALAALATLFLRRRSPRP